jgi:hypothetical protein
LKVATGPSPKSTSQSQEVDAIINAAGDWKGKQLAELRALVKRADPNVVEEVKWKKPSNPMGVPVWSDHGIVCMGGTLKKAVRLTFPHGAQLKDPKRLFNACLEGNAMRCIDLHEGEFWDEAGVKALVLEAAKLNAKAKGR